MEPLRRVDRLQSCLCGNITRVLPSFRVPEGAEISETYAREQGDLAQMLNRRDMKDYEVDVTFPDTDLRTEEIHNPDNPLLNTIIFENPAHPELPRAVIFHDSFGEVLCLFLAAGFSRAVFACSDHVDMRIVEEEKSDIVIQEYVERLCPYGMPIPPTELKRTKKRKLLSQLPALLSRFPDQIIRACFRDTYHPWRS